MEDVSSVSACKKNSLRGSDVEEGDRNYPGGVHLEGGDLGVDGLERNDEGVGEW